jgi:hypothetical protein
MSKKVIRPAAAKAKRNPHPRRERRTFSALKITINGDLKIGAPASKVTLADCNATFERLEGRLRSQVDSAAALADGLAGSDGMKVGAAILPEPKGAIGVLSATAIRIEDLLIALEGHRSRVAQAVG